jgi:ABC-type sugar transport system ATPase subunit
LSPAERGDPRERVPPPAISVEDLAKEYGPVKALSGMTLEVQRGEIHALCGHNGAGKSTLVNVLAGIATPDSGSVEIFGEPERIRSPQHIQELGIAIVEQELSLASNLSVADNVLLGHPDTPVFYRRQRPSATPFLEMVGLDGLDPATPVRDLRLGERQLVEIARVLARHARILILDEPTATLGQAEIARVFAILRRLRADGTTIVFVTHRLGEVFELCDRVSVVREGRTVTSALISEFDRESLIELLVESEGTPSEARADTPRDFGPARLALRGVDLGEELKNVSLTVRSGEIVGIAGQVGSGATELVKVAAGIEEEATGTLEVGGVRFPFGDRTRMSRIGVAYVSEDRGLDGIFALRSVAENLTVCGLGELRKRGTIARGAVRRMAMSLAGSARVDSSRIGDLPLTLSGGNQQKLLVGRALSRPAEGLVLLMCEPTRGVDIASRGEIYEVLRAAAAKGAAILFASTDLEELLDLSDTVYTMFQGEIVSRFVSADVGPSDILSDMTHRREGAGVV